VYLNLQFEVFRPVLSSLAPVTPHPIETAASRGRGPALDPGMSYAEIIAIARSDGARRGWVPPFDVFYSQEFGAYGVGYGDHHRPGLGVPWLFYDDRDGKLIGEVVPGAGTAADRFMQWMLPLHTGRIMGLPGQIIVCVLGLSVSALSITGVAIWAAKRRRREVTVGNPSRHPITYI
jgi:uncharacterized iron-regulated membrane protein